MDGTSVTTVLIGKKTASSGWVDFEINESIRKGNGIIGIRLPWQEDAEIPTSLKLSNTQVIDWDPESFSDEVETSALIAGRRPQKPPVYSRAIIGGCARAI